MTEEQFTTRTFTEAPASWNVKYILDGFDCQLTVRAETGKELLPATLKAIEWLKEHNAEPIRPTHIPLAQQPTPTSEPPKMADGSPDPAWCKIHSTEMKRHEKDGQVWYSHKVGDNYCKGK